MIDLIKRRLQTNRQVYLLIVVLLMSMLVLAACEIQPIQAPDAEDAMAEDADEGHAHDGDAEAHDEGDGHAHDDDAEKHDEGDGHAHDDDAEKHDEGDGHAHDDDAEAHDDGDGHAHDDDAEKHDEGDGHAHDDDAEKHDEGDGHAHDDDAEKHDEGDGHAHDDDAEAHDDGDGHAHDDDAEKHDDGDGHDHDDGDGHAHDDDSAMMGDPDAGAYIFSVAIGCGCHFNRDLGALAGGSAFEGNYGVVYSANLTPHETGIGNVSDEKLADAIRFGKSSHTDAHGDDGHGHSHASENLFFAMPRYATIADDDVMHLIAFLRSLDPVENEIPSPELNIEIPDFTPAQAPLAEAPTAEDDPIVRGEYLVSIANCTRCHTPRGEDGRPNMDLFLAGAPFRDTAAPNLTPDELTGLGGWAAEEIAVLLSTGLYPDGTEAHPAMKAQTDRGLNKLTEADALSIAAFLQSLDPVDHLP